LACLSISAVVIELWIVEAFLFRLLLLLASVTLTGIYQPPKMQTAVGWWLQFKVLNVIQTEINKLTILGWVSPGACLYYII
jgi:hypothetical protein